MPQWFHAVLCGPVLLGCAPERRETGVGPGLSGGVSGNGNGNGKASAGSVPGDGASGSAGGDDASPRVDVGAVGGTGDGVEDQGCKKADFLFVIDNSGSMESEQASLTRSFPGFIDAIRNTVMVDDIHIMVVDTDAGPQPEGPHCGSATCAGPICTCQNDAGDGRPFQPGCCCAHACNANPTATCDGVPCTQWWGSPCADNLLGVGQIRSAGGQPCGIAGPNHYLEAGQANLEQTFACLGTRGIYGSWNEQTMQAMLAAVTTKAAPGQCNQGFLRDDAILIVTVITDEEDDPRDPPAPTTQDDLNSPGQPAEWRQALIDAKHGDEGAVVVLGLVGDTGRPGAVCRLFSEEEGAEPSPRLIQFAESFTNGTWASVCVPDYAPFFAQAVTVVGNACRSFSPPR